MWPAGDALGREDARATSAFMRTLLAFKLATVAPFAWAVRVSRERVAVLSTTTWPWLIIPVLAIAGPIAYRLRLRRMKARRAELVCAEWMVENES